MDYSHVSSLIVQFIQKICVNIARVERNTKRKLLDEFIHDKFDIEELPDLWFYLSKNWTSMLLNSEQQSEEIATINSLHYSRFLIAMILKSMTLSLHSRGLLGIIAFLLT